MAILRVLRVGPKGEQGDQGEPGIKGDQGEPGIKGDQGEPASEITIKTINGNSLLGTGDISINAVKFIDKGNSNSTTQVIDFSAGNNQRIAVTGPHTISIINWPIAGFVGELLLELVNGAAYTVTWPVINWIKADGSMTTIFSDNGIILQTTGIDFVLLWTRDGGTTIYGGVMR